MESTDLLAFVESHRQQYELEKQRIANRLREEIAHFRDQLSNYNPHSTCEVERWTAGIYHSLLERRTNMLNTLFADRAACTDQV